MVPISIQASYVLILEWLNPGDQKTGAILRDNLLVRQVPVEFVECRRADDVLDALTKARNEITTRGVPIVHIESHGDDPKEVKLTERAFGTDVDSISWVQLGGRMSPLNQASDFNILLVGAACWGLSAVATFRLHEVAPFVGCIGFITSVVESSLRDAISELYRCLLVEHLDITCSVTSANRELHRADEALAFTSAPRLAMMAAAKTYKAIASESGFDEISSQIAKAAKLPGMATRDLSDSTWKAKREEIAKRLMERAWTEWFPQPLPSRSSAYHFDWDSLAQDIGLGF